jgi:hypothetical protein
MPEIFINGHPVQAEDNQTVMQAALANGFYIPYFCWHPRCRWRAIAASVRSRWRAAAGLDIACNMPVQDGHARADRLRCGCASSARRRCSSSRSTTPSTAASATRPANARCRTITSRTTASLRSRTSPRSRDQVPSAVRADPARQRALHPVFALRALHARDLEIERARHQEPRRPVADARRRGPAPR